jgi:hypothetical protein
VKSTQFHWDSGKIRQFSLICVESIWLFKKPFIRQISSENALFLQKENVSNENAD